ncbi:Ig-like domain-containing protein, partial [Enterobacter cloacae]|uniref:Ig-like domain-containing protein n=1 Tax=Enterobacter cloacae TaxID=550 RepID=UPI0021D0337A|nr:hypothetical protein [Enterobacter cloacae]
MSIDTTDVEVSIDRVVDNVGETANVAAGGVTDDTTPELQGTGKAGSVVHVYDGTTALGQATVDSSGKWSLTLTTALAEGAHTLTAYAVDAAGKQSDTVSVSFTVDTTAPSSSADKLAITGADDDVGSIQGTLQSGDLTDDPTPTLHGIAEAGSTVTVYDGSTELGRVKADANGKWSFTPT